jgi:folate-binding protein YgfZ
MADIVHESVSAPENQPGDTRAFSSPREEFAALRTSCGVFDLESRTRIKLTGDDRIKWLNGMVTNNVRDLAVGRGVYSFLLNPQGHILADMNIYNLGAYLVVDTDAAQSDKVRATFEHYIIMDDVELSSDASDHFTAIGLQGPRSREVMRAAGINFTGQEPIAIEDTTWNGVGISLVHSRPDGFEAWLPPATRAGLWLALVAAGATPTGAEALEMWRIAEGIPRYGQDIRERELPQETMQERALSYTKGCYIGQEIVERIRSRGAVHRALAGFTFTGGPPAAGTKLAKDRREVGEVTSVATLPVGSGPMTVGLGYVRREAGSPGTKLDASGVEATVSALPFSIDQ